MRSITNLEFQYISGGDCGDDGGGDGCNADGTDGSGPNGSAMPGCPDGPLDGATCVDGQVTLDGMTVYGSNPPGVTFGDGYAGEWSNTIVGAVSGAAIGLAAGGPWGAATGIVLGLHWSLVSHATSFGPPPDEPYPYA
jgi:hypothetical protein